MSISHECSNCKRITQRDLLMSKKVMFQELGVKPKIFRSRVIAWLCPTCVAADEDWQRPAYESPGRTSEDKVAQ